MKHCFLSLLPLLFLSEGTAAQGIAYISGVISDKSPVRFQCQFTPAEVAEDHNIMDSASLDSNGAFSFSLSLPRPIALVMLTYENGVIYEGPVEPDDSIIVSIGPGDYPKNLHYEGRGSDKCKARK